MKKLVKRVLKLTPGGKKFIKSYKDLVAENEILKTKSEQIASGSKKTSQILNKKDYEVFF